ncbi:unnamed protein product [Effrenium voratum]|nr:unnamed protein product [Effrenium voratum]
MATVPGDLGVGCAHAGDVLDAAFFLLAVRSIGKYRTIRRQLGPNLQRPETVLMHIIDFYPNVVPTTRGLSDSAHDLLKIKSLELQLAFQFPQMLQGENVPANLSQLQLFLREKGGEQTLKFYVVFLLGFLSGLQGGRGSAFMTASNAKNILLGLHTVQHILDKKPAYLYWTYIYQRGLLLQRVARSLEDLALCRLACLCRVRSSQEFQQLEESWFQLDDWQQEVLTSHFLASGINNTAIVFEFLPLCLERAKGNPQVGVPCLLEILVGLVEAVLAGSERGQKQNIMTVDLSNLGAFILLVQNRFVFQTCLARSKLRKRNNPHEFHLDLTEDNWSRVNERQTDLVAVSDTVREILHAQRNKPMPLLCV